VRHARAELGVHLQAAALVGLEPGGFDEAMAASSRTSVDESGIPTSVSAATLGSVVATFDATGAMSDPYPMNDPSIESERDAA
jgi:hypothetical protein